ncbi:hypothetical protein [Streptomyces sp. NPDC056401]|uniref:hypothetical protein n=1 Tax=Streptomyces sp. NPDC056401 TaxID=3345809 RepID=UPI0035D6CBB5
MFDADRWKPALVQAAVIPDTPGPGNTAYAASPENGVQMLRHRATRWVSGYALGRSVQTTVVWTPDSRAVVVPRMHCL